MVIAQVIGDLRIGGAERLFVNLCNALGAHRPIVVLTGEAEPMPNLRGELRRDIDVYRVRVRRRSWVRDVWRLSRLFREAGCDIVHTHMFWANLYGSLAAGLARLPVVTSEHGRNDWKRRWHRWLEVNCISRFAQARLCVSQDILLQRRDVDGVPETLLRLVPNGTLVPPLAVTAKQNRIIGSVGRLVGAKDYPTLIRAFSILNSRDEDVRLEIVGDGTERAAIEECMVHEGVGSKVTLAGSQTDINDWLARWGIFASSSVREGQPVALLEAMAAGLPCVATAVGGVPDTIVDGVEGIIVPSRDPEALADAMQRLLDDAELREACGTAARERVKRDFSIETLAATCENIYASALQPKNGSHGS